MINSVKDFVNSLNFYQMLSILWGVSLVISIFRREPINVLLDAVMVIINVALGEWIF